MTNHITMRQNVNNTSDLAKLFTPEPPIQHTPQQNISSKNVYEEFNYLLPAAAHGLHFKDTGEAYIFFDNFDHFVKIDIPEKHTFEKFHVSNCAANYVYYLHMYANESRPHLEYENTPQYLFCSQQAVYYNKQIEDFQLIIESSYEAFEEKIRGKRSILGVIGAVLAIPVVAGGIAGGVAGAFTGAAAGYIAGRQAAKAVVAKVEEKLKNLENRVTVNENKIQVMSDSLLGFSKTIIQLEKDTNNKMSVLTTKVNQQIQNVEIHLAKIAKEQLEQNNRINFVEYSRKLEARLSTHYGAQLNSLQNEMYLELDKYRVLEDTFNNLATGQLSRNLIGFNKMREILNTIKLQLHTIYELGIPIESLAVYYSLPIYSYVITKEDDKYKMYVYMRIPLKGLRGTNRYRVVTPSTSAFPCYDDKCLLQFSRQNGSLQKFELEQTSYLISPITNNLIYETNMDNFECQHSLNGRLCFTFYPTLLQEPSPCTRSIHKWNENGIIRWCPIRPAAIEEYKVKSLKRNVYVLHKDLIDHYELTCYSETATQHVVSGWVESVEIPTNCEIYIPNTHQRLFGPYSKDYASIESLDIFTARSTLLKAIAEKYYNVSLLMKAGDLPTPSYLTNFTVFNNTENEAIREEMDFILNNKQLTEVTKEIIEIQNKLRKGMEETADSIHTINYTSSFWGYFSLTGDCIQMLTTIIVIFGILSYTNLFGLLGASVIIMEAQPVNGFQIIPDIHLLPEISVDVMNDTIATQFFMNVAFVFIFTTFLLLFIYYGTFRKIIFSYHYGRGLANEWSREGLADSPTPATLNLNLSFGANYFRYMKRETIYIRIRIDHLFTGNTKAIEVKNPKSYWYTVKRLGTTGLALSEEIHLIGIDQNGKRTEEDHYSVFIPISEITWSSRPTPIASEKGWKLWRCIR